MSWSSIMKVLDPGHHTFLNPYVKIAKGAKGGTEIGNFINTHMLKYSRCIAQPTSSSCLLVPWHRSLSAQMAIIVYNLMVLFLCLWEKYSLEDAFIILLEM